MGKLHDAWKNAKAKAKAAGMDVEGLFKRNLGAALDKFEEAWAKLKPGLESKTKAKTLTLAEYEAAVKVLDPLALKVSETALKYSDDALATAKKYREKQGKTAVQKEKAKLEAMVNEAKAIITILQMTINPAAQEHCRLYLKGIKPKG